MDWVPFLPQIIYSNAGFNGLRKIRKYIEDYEPRFDPTVVPLDSESHNPFADNSSSSIDHVPAPCQNPKARYYSVADYHTKYLSGELTPTTVVKAILPLIRRDTTPVGEHSVAWFACQVDRVLAAAEASTKRYQEKRPLGLFDGVPAAVKDEYDLDGYRSCLGSLNDYTGEVPFEGSITSWCARKLEEAGAVILGKLSMHEFGLGVFFLATTLDFP